MRARVGLAVSLAVLWTAGCGKQASPPGNHGHDHGDEDQTAQITVFGERHEIFAEHRLVVAGTPTRFVTHVTDLKTLEPRREGPLEFELRLGAEPPIEHVEQAPARAGIYEPMLTFPKAGDWGIAVVVRTEQGDKRVQFPAVKVFASAHDAQHADIPEPPAGISFLKEQQWKVLAGTEPAAKRRLVEQMRVPAEVRARPGALAKVTPPLGGRLLAPEGKPMPVVGQRVEAGQVLATIAPSFSEMGARFVEAEGEVARAKLEVEQAELALKRIERLAQAEAKSGRELQEAQFAQRQAQARYEAALAVVATYRQATTQTAGNGGTRQPVVELRAPIAGVLTEQSGAAVGEYVPAEQALFTILDAGTVFLVASVPEASVARLGESRAASILAPGGRVVPVTGEAGGRLVMLGIQVEKATRTVPLIYEATNEQNALRVGQSIDLLVETARSEDVLAVPDSAIVEEDGRPIAFVQLAGETFEKRDVALGIRDGNWVQVLSGLEEGERVVTRGAYAVRLASVSSAIPAHGHVH